MPGVKISALPSFQLNGADLLAAARAGSTVAVTGQSIIDLIGNGDANTFNNSKTYVDGELLKYVKIAGSTMTGALILHDHPTATSPDKQAATKKYVDNQIQDVTGYTLKLVPTGAINMFPCINPPNGWLELDGTDYLRTAYPALWAFAQASGNIVNESAWTGGQKGSFSYGNGSNTFRIPDLRGYFVRGVGTNADGAVSTGLGAVQSDAFQTHRHNNTLVLTDNQHDHGPNDGFLRKLKKFWGGGGAGFDDEKIATSDMSKYVGDEFKMKVEKGPSNISVSVTVTDPNGASRVADETRPKNIALMYCIKL